MSNILIIGVGEIGSAIAELEIGAGNSVSINELGGNSNIREDNTYDICHVCIPYSDKFIDVVADYLNGITVDACVIHSTVEMGTCSKVQ